MIIFTLMTSITQIANLSVDWDYIFGYSAVPKHFTRYLKSIKCTTAMFVLFQFDFKETELSFHLQRLITWPDWATQGWRVNTDYFSHETVSHSEGSYLCQSSTDKHTAQLNSVQDSCGSVCKPKLFFLTYLTIKLELKLLMIFDYSIDIFQWTDCLV